MREQSRILKVATFPNAQRARERTRMPDPSKILGLGRQWEAARIAMPAVVF